MNGTGAANRLLGGSGIDTIRGRGGDDRIWGLDGADMLRGGWGDDTLWAGRGADTLTGGPGQDRLIGGFGGRGDTFVFDDHLHSRVGTGHDVIRNFSHDSDRIDLRGIDARPGSDADDAFAWGGHAAAAHTVWWRDTTDGVLLRADVTGDSHADFEVLLRDAPDFGRLDVLL